MEEVLNTIDAFSIVLKEFIEEWYGRKK
jgi:hypothetical protein